MMTSNANSASRPTRFLAGIGLLDLIPAVGELLGDGLPQGRLVLDEQQMFRRVSHLETRQHFDTARGLGASGPKSCLATHAVARALHHRYPIPTGGQLVVERKTISIMKACELVGVSRRTIYNWLSSGKIEYVRTAGGSVRIFVDTLVARSEPDRSPGGRATWQAEERKPGLMAGPRDRRGTAIAVDRWTNRLSCGSCSTG